MSDIADDLDASRAPLLDHLLELRRRLLYCIAAVGAAFAVCWYFAEDIFGFLVQPLLQAGQKTVIYTQLFEAFFVQIKVAFFSAMMLSFPVIANQLWQFVAAKNATFTCIGRKSARSCRFCWRHRCCS